MVFLVFGAVVVCGWILQRPSEIIDNDTILAIPNGEAKLVSELANTDFTTVCVLHPYQERLPPQTGDIDIARANAHLSEIGYAGDEGHWAMLLIRAKAIELAVFKRSAELDIGTARQLQSMGANKLLPIGFVPKNCADGEHVAVSKIRVQDRTYVILGETH